MYKFQPYNPEVPRMVTSFKGNQKLIFEGYRYNIHHIVPNKNVKTWRCVCAKKLTSARSWCKGRAETWDNDTHGTSKGEHNHPAEHNVAELEYFKSQLILAAIAHPDAALNDLIDEATSMMSPGVAFNSRESLKKSLTVARKTAENGGFKIKSYKNSAGSTGSRSKNNSQNQLPTTIPRDESIYSMKIFENSTMASLLSLAKQCQETNNNNELEDTRSNPSIDDFQQSTSSTTSSILNHMGIASECDDDKPPLLKFPRLDETNPEDSFAGILNSFNGNNTLNSSGYASLSGLSNKDWNSSLALDRSNNGMDSSRSTPLSSYGYESGSNKRKNVDKAKRVNDIFNKLSHKAAIAASSTPNTPATTVNTGTSMNTTANTSNGGTNTTTSSTQTDQELYDGAEIRVSACLGSLSDCSCRIIRVCCCSNETCTRGLKRAHP